MEFSEILGRFEINNTYLVQSYILGQQGYIFELRDDIAYLFEETRGNGRSWIYIQNEKVDLTQNELKKIHSLIKLSQISIRKLKPKDFWLYSSGIEKSMEQMLKDHPELVKGSTHLAFAPHNYTRFSENLLFDFDYLYNDLNTSALLSDFENHYLELKKNFGDRQLPDRFSDDILYRFLLQYVRDNRVSINGRVSLPEFIDRLYEHCLHLTSDDIFLNTGPYLIQLKRGTIITPFLTRKTKVLYDDWSNRSLILEFNVSTLTDVLHMEKH